MRAKLWLMLAVAVVIGGGVGHEALAGDDSTPAADGRRSRRSPRSRSLTPAQKAARKRILAQAEFMQENDLNCGCRHHFPAPKS